MHMAKPHTESVLVSKSTNRDACASNSWKAKSTAWMFAIKALNIQACLCHFCPIIEQKEEDRNALMGNTFNQYCPYRILYFSLPHPTVLPPPFPCSSLPLVFRSKPRKSKLCLLLPDPQALETNGTSCKKPRGILRGNLRSKDRVWLARTARYPQRASDLS